MQILLPPSETKERGGSQPALGRPGSTPEGAWAELAHAAELHSARAAVLTALETLSSDETAALKALKLGAKSAGELAHNHALTTSPTMPAIERYTGVLYDALDVASLADAEREWIHTRVSVQSALFGLIRAADTIPAYRLSASTRLPALDQPLKRLWQAAHAEVWDPTELVIDARSKDYAALAPCPHAYVLDVAERTPDGSVRALGHFNKAAKGDLVRRLAHTRFDTNDIDALLDWAASEDLDLSVTAEHTLQYVPAGTASRSPRRQNRGKIAETGGEGKTA